jgi:hypothetical protein
VFQLNYGEKSMVKNRFNFLSSLFFKGILLGMGCVSTLIAPLVAPNPVGAAEEIRLLAGPVSLSIPIDSLETFAQTGETKGGILASLPISWGMKPWP